MPKARSTVSKGKRAAPFDKKKKEKPAEKAATDKSSKAVDKKKGIPTALFVARPHNFGVGQHIQPKRDLRRFMKWPRYVQLQRQRRVLTQRLKVPPAINQFSKAMDKSTALELFKLLSKYKPEDAHEKKERLKSKAEAKVDGKEEAEKKPCFVKYGLNHCVSLIEEKKAKLVVIADDVDPIELVVFLPTLCAKLDVPYCIVKGKARLGQIVHKKTATCLVVTDVRNEDKPALSRLVELSVKMFNERYEELRKVWGGGLIGMKSRARIAKREKAIAKELAQKFG